MFDVFAAVVAVAAWVAMGAIQGPRDLDARGLRGARGHCSPAGMTGRGGAWLEFAGETRRPLAKVFSHGLKNLL